MAGFGGLDLGTYRRRPPLGRGRDHAASALLPTPGFDRDKLARTVEAEVIPRLMLLHRDVGQCGPEVPPTPGEIADFARILLEQENGVATAYVTTLQAKGASLEMLFLQLFAPTARLLGDLWREDLSSFTEVSVGLSRLQQMLHSLRSPFEESGDGVWNGCKALLAPAPGETHSFGLGVVESFLLRAGWHVDALWGASTGEVVAACRKEKYDILGFSLSCDVLLDALASTIQAARRASSNKAIKIVVGGRYFSANPDMVKAVGADATALDGRDATVQLGRLVTKAVQPGW